METILQFRNIIFSVIFIFVLSTILNSKNFYYTPENINGLHLKYNFGFWLTSKAATGDFSVKKTGEKFVVKLTGETSGVIGAFLSYRKDTMISIMKYNKKLKRFIPLKFIKQVKIGKNFKQSIYIFDYKNMRIIKKRLKIKINEKEENSPENDFIGDYFENKTPHKIIEKSKYYIPLKDKVFDDYLSAALNFIIGAYGMPSKKNIITIKLFPEKKKKKRNRKLKVYFIKKFKNFFKIKADLNVDFISDKIRKVYSLIDKNMIPEKVEIPTGTIIGTLKAERIKIGKK